MRWSLVLFTALVHLHSKDAASKPECCLKRRVGIHTYNLIEPDTDPPLDMGGCLENCAYRKRGDLEADDFDEVFCFERGNQSSSCLGGTNLEQGPSAVSGYVIMEGRVVCGDFWDYNAAKVVCEELGLGTPKEVFGGSRFGVPVKEYHEMVPFCTGNEEKLDSCKLKKNSNPCNDSAGLMCSRITAVNGSTMLDGLPICADGFTNKEATALCKEEGFVDGKVNSAASQVSDVPTGWSLQCNHENLETCQKAVCVNGSSASYTCGNASEVEIFGGTFPGQGTVLYNGGLVCDDSWDIQDADVVCRELGYSGADNATTHSYFGPAETPLQAAQNIKIPYTADEVNCKGNETSLSKCDHIVKSDCDVGEAAGVMCTLELKAGKTRNRRAAAAALAQAAPAISQLAETGANIIGSAVNYFDQKEKEYQAYLKERPDEVDLSSAGVEIKMQNEKGYMDLGGEFQSGGVDLKIQNIPGNTAKTEDGGQAFTYPAGLGPMLMNGCFGTGYKIGDPCYAAKRLNTRCLDMMEAANYVGVGFDGTGAYNHAGRRKSLIQRSCAGKSTYQGEDVPDNMNVFGIYDSSCTGKSYESLEARSMFQREQAKMGENADFLKSSEAAEFKVEGEMGFGTVDVDGNYNSNSKKETGTTKTSRSNGKAAAKDSKTVSGIFEFSCRIRRYEIFLDEVKPDQLSEAFLQDYMALPIRYFDFKNKAPRKFTDFLLRWGTHFIKSASFGGKFTLLRQSTLSGEETKEEWQAREQKSATSMFESRTSSKEAHASYSVWDRSAEVSGKSEGTQDSNSAASSEDKSSSNESSSRSETSVTMDDIIVEGGHQRVASILSDKNRAGFKGEFVSWLDSIPQYPKGYDFKFGEIADLLDINYRSLVKDFKPCWEIENQEPGKDDSDNDITTYKVTVKDENGDEKEEVRECRFNSLEDFQEQMDKRRLSLKHAVTLFAKNRGRSWNELSLPAGVAECEKKYFGTDKIIYDDLLDGSSYEVAFDLLLPIGDRIMKDDIVLLRFVESVNSSEVKSGSWQVNEEQSRAAGQIGQVVLADEMKVYVYGARFTYYSIGTRNYLKWTKLDCLYNLRRFKNLKNIECDFNGDLRTTVDNEDGDIDWVGVPLATVTSLNPPTEYLPCNMEWTNHQMLMSDSSCVRFTAASKGPIYFGLSAVPDKLSTWYYFRITSNDVTVYKGNNLLEASTDANSAVGLGNKNLFQSFIICSEHGVEEDDNRKKTVSTKLTYGKIGADDTINSNAKLQSYLIVNDVEKEPIKPAFYAFGSGEFQVQIVDIEVTDVPPVECAGDTFDTGSGCQTSCRIDDLIALSRQTNDLKCFNKNEDPLENPNRVPAGGYCVVSCENKEGKVEYPKNARTICKYNSEWTSAVRCSAKCPPIHLEEGLLSIDGGGETKSIKTNAKCTDIDGVPLTSFDYILEGSACDIGDPGTNFCGVDKDGLEYYTSDQYRSLSCTEDGSWKTDVSTVAVTEPVCKAMPCPQMMEANVTSSVAVKCKKENKDANIINGFMNEKVVCELESCKPTHFVQNPSQTNCEDGSWTNSLKCSPRDATCTPADIPQIANGTLDCTGNQMDGENFLGGSVCQLTCDTGYLSNGVVQCINAPASQGTKGMWSDHTCVKDKRCDQDLLPSVTNGNIQCGRSANRLQSRVPYVETGTVCEIECDSGYEVEGGTSVVCQAKIWETTGTCLTRRCDSRNIVLNALVDHATVECNDEDKVYRKGDTCPVECDTGYRHNTGIRDVTCGIENSGDWKSSSQCVRDGNWGPWRSWSTCTKTCGTGTQSRSRQCNNPPPDNGGEKCPGSSSARQDCNTQGCPVNGNWGPWGSWSYCSKRCERGTQTRWRNCNNPAPAYGGRQCSGSSSDSKDCNNRCRKLDNQNVLCKDLTNKSCGRFFWAMTKTECECRDVCSSRKKCKFYIWHTARSQYFEQCWLIEGEGIFFRDTVGATSGYCTTL